MPGFLEISATVLKPIRQTPTAIIIDILVVIGIFWISWAIYIGLFLIAVRSGLLKDPADIDIETESSHTNPDIEMGLDPYIMTNYVKTVGVYDPYRSKKSFKELLAHWDKMQRLRVYGYATGYGTMNSREQQYIGSGVEECDV